jgi:antitoxin CcdA
MENEHLSKRRSVNLSIRADILIDAKAYKVNASREAEKAIALAVKKAKEQEWLKGAGPAIEAYNKRIKEHGLYLEPYWMTEGNDEAV